MLCTNQTDRAESEFGVCFKLVNSKSHKFREHPDITEILLIIVHWDEKLQTIEQTFWISLNYNRILKVLSLMF